RAYEEGRKRKPSWESPGVALPLLILLIVVLQFGPSAANFEAKTHYSLPSTNSIWESFKGALPARPTIRLQEDFGSPKSVVESWVGTGRHSMGDWTLHNGVMR